MSKEDTHEHTDADTHTHTQHKHCVCKSNARHTQDVCLDENIQHTLLRERERAR